MIVYDEITDWDFTINPELPDFTETINDTEVSFTNTSNDYDAVVWDFGDGNTSTNDSPVHNYTATGEYIVTLTTTKCGKSHTKTKSITIANLSS